MSKDDVAKMSTKSYLVEFDEALNFEKQQQYAEAAGLFARLTTRGFAPAQHCLLRVMTKTAWANDRQSMLAFAPPVDQDEPGHLFYLSFAERRLKDQLAALKEIVDRYDYAPALFYYGRYGGSANGPTQVRMIQRAVELGNAAAMDWLSHLYQHGVPDVLEKDDGLEQYYLELAASLGHPESLCSLGARLHPITKKYEQTERSDSVLLSAVALFEEAASYGHERGVKLFLELCHRYPDRVQPWGDFNPPYVGGPVTWWKFRRFPRIVRKAVFTTALVFNNTFPHDIVHMIVGFVCTK